MANGLKNAAKCRECARTIDVGSSAWFNKDGAQGRKITCSDCHQRKVEDPSGEKAPPPETEKKKPQKR